MNNKKLPSEGNESSVSNIKNDFLASIVVFLVALPLCMGIAIASGVPVAAGLLTGIVGGIVVGCLAGCPLQVSGPAAGLAVIVFEVVQRFGFEMLGIVVLIAGTIQLVAGILKFGQWFRAVSPAVIKGMLAGIGVLIFASQFHVMLDDKPKGSGIQNLVAIPSAIFKGLSLPEFNPREVREYRTGMLRTVGDLHRRQLGLKEELSKGQGHGAIEPPNGMAEPRPVDLSGLNQRQSALTQELIETTTQLEQQEANFERTPKSQRICEASIATRHESEAALAAIQQGDLETISTTQTTAIESLAKLLAAHKSHNLAAILGFLTISVILLWQGFAPKKIKAVPAPLVAVMFATLAAAALAIPVIYVEVPNNLWNEIRFPDLAAINSVSWSALFQAGLLIAVVASAETLLCATAVDQMHQGVRTKYDRELFAQGVGNMICGVLGALPMTGVIVRSTANIQAGGKTRMSAIFHGVWLLIFVAFLAFLLRMIPTASLAAILVYTGYKLVNPKSIRELYKYGWSEVGIYAATVGTIVFTDLLTGVLVGIGLAAAKLLYTFSHLATDLKISPDRKHSTLHLHGAATFVRLPKLAAELENVPAKSELHVDFQHLDYIDHACLDLLLNWAKQHESTGGKLVLDWGSLHAKFKQQNGSGESVDTIQPSEKNGSAAHEVYSKSS